MADSRKRRIVRRAVMTVAGLALLTILYVGAWLAVSRAADKNTISIMTADSIRPAFAPILRYCDSDLPGARASTELYWKVNPPIVLGNNSGIRAVRMTPLSPSRVPTGFYDNAPPFPSIPFPGAFPQSDTTRGAR